MSDSFTFFGKFGDVCSALNEGDRRDLVYAICMYGTCGEEVELPYHLAPLMLALKEDIEHSKASRARGAKGGRPPKTGDGGADKPEVSDSAKPPVTEEAKPVVSGCERKTESQYNTVQSNTVQSNTDRGSGRRFAPPTVEEVRAHCAEKGYGFDPEQFVAFYESKGWRVGKNPMKSWKAACVTWDSRRRRERGGVTSVGDVYSQL